MDAALAISKSFRVVLPEATLILAACALLLAAAVQADLEITVIALDPGAALVGEVSRIA